MIGLAALYEQSGLASYESALRTPPSCQVVCRLLDWVEFDFSVTEIDDLLLHIGLDHRSVGASDQ